MEDQDIIKTLPTRGASAANNPAIAPLLDPTELVDGRYRIERELGQGAMGVVFEATDLGLGRRVALKVIAREFASDPAFVERFVREAKALAAIRHQNIVQVHALGQHRGTWYYAMEFIRGHSLDGVLFDYATRGQRFPTREALGIVRQIASGLSAVHAAQIIHRDVKPANIMLERETGRPVLIDFGIARPAFNNSTRSTLLVGSPAYMAPEQIQAQAGADLTPAVDLYALGCVSYELLALRPPFDSNDVYEVLRDQVSRVPAALSSIRPELARFDGLLARLLAKRPEERPGGCLAVVREIDRLTVEWESERDGANLAPSSAAAAADTARVLLVASDPPFLAHARRACDGAFAQGWEELGAGLSLDASLTLAREHAPHLMLLHCDALDARGFDAVSGLREYHGTARTRVLAFGGTADALDRWRLGSLGVTELHPSAIGPDEMTSLIARAVRRSAHSGMPGARPSTIVRPEASGTPGAGVPIELFLLVLASGWSEGALPARAGELVLEAARAEGHAGDNLAALCRACDAPIDLVDIDVTDLSMSTRAYAYAFATWIALSDGVISQREECTLHVLAFVLGLPVPERTAIQSTIEQICERGSASLRDGFRYADYARVVAPGIERMLRAQQRTPIPGIPLPFRP